MVRSTALLMKPHSLLQTRWAKLNVNNHIPHSRDMVVLYFIENRLYARPDRKRYFFLFLAHALACRKNSASRKFPPQVERANQSDNPTAVRTKKEHQSKDWCSFLVLTTTG